MYICLHMYNVQMPSLMYLIFAKKQRITFFDPLGGQVEQKFSTLIDFDSSNHWAPFSRALVLVPALFSPTNKIYFICIKKKHILFAWEKH